MLNHITSYKYQLFLETNAQKKRVLTKKEKDGVVCNFKSPITDKNRPKIYVLKLEDSILYIGYTGQSVSSRLSAGIRASGENGYHGYKWRDHNQVDLLLFVFDNFSENADDETNKKEKDFIEAIEAELVFKVRTETDEWPLCQNEIHFNNHQSEKVREITDIIYSEIIKK